MSYAAEKRKSLTDFSRQDFNMIRPGHVLMNCNTKVFKRVLPFQNVIVNFR